MVKGIIYLKKKPYYYYATYTDWNNVNKAQRRFNRLRYFYIKGYHKRNRTTAYHLYFDKKVY